MTKTLASVDNHKFLRRCGSSENNFWLANPIHYLSSLFNFILVKRLFHCMDSCKFVTVDDNCLTFFESVLFREIGVFEEVVILQFWIGDDVDFVSYCCSSWWLISSDHDNFDTCISAFQHRYIDRRAWWIIQGNNTH